MGRKESNKMPSPRDTCACMQVQVSVPEGEWEPHRGASRRDKLTRRKIATIWVRSHAQLHPIGYDAEFNVI